MKLSWGFVASSIYCAVEAARDAHVFVYDPTGTTAPRAPSTVDPETARLILAQRLGLSRFHSIHHPSEDTLRQIKTFGGRKQSLFGGDYQDATKAHVLLWVEDVEDVQALIKDPQVWSSGFTISNAPPASDNDALVRDMILQAQSMPQKTDYKGRTLASLSKIDRVLSKLKQVEIYNEYLAVLRTNKDDHLSPAQLTVVLDALLSATRPDESGGFAVTLVAMPPSSPNEKRSAHPYGVYDLPSNMRPRSEPTEAPFSLFSSEPSNSPSPFASDLEDFPVITQAESGNSTTPPLGILPRCFESLSACKDKTNQCSGHGTCEKLSSAGPGGRAACYGCKCSPTVEHPDTGMETHTKTTYWGGPACQKKDISVPFWLFVSSGILFAFLISSGIGLLYSVGSEELPSVIGAGVSGPVRK